MPSSLILTEALAKSLGNLVWWVDLAFRLEPEKAGYCSVLELQSAEDGDGTSGQHFITRLLPCRPAIAGEILVVDDHLVDCAPLRHAIRVLLQAIFDPVVIGTGKAIIARDGLYEGIVFFPLNTNRNIAHGDSSSAVPITAGSNLAGMFYEQKTQIKLT